MEIEDVIEDDGCSSDSNAALLLNVNFVDKWPLSSPNELAFVLIAYFMFAFKIGPHIMEKRSPFQIKPLLVVYNGFKIVNSAILTYRFFSYIMDKGLFPKSCNYDDHTVYIIAALYWKYMITKIIDLFDTIFFVLRKKRNQITFLHVYHHTFMVIITWSSLKYDPRDHWAFMAVFNCGVHTIMYVYYGISALGPDYTKYLWWKKYLTVLQLVQFVLVLTHIVIQTYISQCPIHAGTYWVGLANCTLFVILFTDFYRKRYGSGIEDKMAEFSCTRRED